MTIHYDAKSDLLYLRLETTQETLINIRLSDDIVLDMGKDDKIIGIEIMDASKNINLDKLIPIEYSKAG